MENKELLQKLNFLIKEINETHTRLQNAKAHFQPIETALLTQQVVNLYGHLTQLNNSMNVANKQTTAATPTPDFKEASQPSNFSKREEPAVAVKEAAVATPKPEPTPPPVQEKPAYQIQAEVKPQTQTPEPVQTSPAKEAEITTPHQPQAVQKEEPEPAPQIKQPQPATTYSARTDSGRFNQEQETKPETSSFTPSPVVEKIQVPEPAPAPQPKPEPKPEPATETGAKAEPAKENYHVKEVKEEKKQEETPDAASTSPNNREEPKKVDINHPEPQTAPEPQPQEPVKAVVEEEKPEIKASSSTASSTINTRETGSQQMSLNERFAQQTVKKNLADKLKLSPIKDLKSAMSLNQRISYIKILFHGNDEEFKKALSFINDSKNFSEAKYYVQSELASKYEWNEENPVTQEFMELVYRKFL